MKIEVTVNKIKYQVPENIHPKTTLNYFIRNFVKLTGTKYMCLEGGCGACIVAVCLNNQTFSVNSCLVPIFICHGWNIITVEGIGNKKVGYHNLQSTLAQSHGSQCGFCSPAMVMNMYCLVQSRRNTTNDIENSFGSNICRCTGYRPILDAFQKLSDNKILGSLINSHDIEDLPQPFIFPRSCNSCENSYKDFVTVDLGELKPIYLKLSDAEFFKVFNINQIFEIYRNYPCCTYILNGGNTGNGVYRTGKKEIYIDINSVHDLHKTEQSNTTLRLGGGVTLEVMKEIFHENSNKSGFQYLRKLADHIDMIGHVSMRNIGTIAGSLMLKHEHREFCSDLFLILETVGAKMHILASEDLMITLNFMEFLKTDMYHKLIYAIVLPQLSVEYNFTSYKIMPVAQNAHALVNAGFLFKLDSKTTVLEKPNVIFGGINPEFIHATKTEAFLVGKKLFDKEVLKDALNILSGELNPDYILPNPTPKFRKTLAQGIFYKFILSLQPNRIDFRFRSGGSILHRKISSGTSTYDIDKKLWPVNKPLPKLDAIHQTSGEAIYINDIPIKDDEVFCVLTLAIRPGDIKCIDFSEAMQMDGVIAFYSAKDVPAKNICINSKKPHPAIVTDEPLFADKKVLYAGQPYGVIVATSEYKAFDAAKKVKLIYVSEVPQKAVITIQEVLTSNDVNRIKKMFNRPATTSPGKNVKFTISGNINAGSQYHYTMEPQSCLCVPIEDGLEVFAACQQPDLIQYSISTCLGIPHNTINMSVKRIGGAYGAKITRPAHIACACAMVAFNLNRPARLIMSIEDMMSSMGKRPSAYLHYDIGTNDLGKIQYLNLHYFTNEGYVFNDILMFVISALRNCYDYSTWNMQGHNLQTDLPCNTWCRAPGSSHGIAMIETIMDHIAKVTNRDPVQVRIENLDANEKKSIQPIIDEIIKTSEYESRRKILSTYNKYNRWKKRGIALVIMKFAINFKGPFYALVSIYARDGTVSISHAGIEIGQGINTKVAQVAAYILGIDVNLISIKPYTSLTAPNAQGTVGSITSDCCTSATKYACEQLIERLKPIREKLKNPTWQELVYEAYDQGIDLCAIHRFTPTSTGLPKPYAVYGATVAEVEVDVLTGQHIVQRVDILEDTGVSLNQTIDMGQVQGAFVMGLGYFTSEELIYNPDTGALVNNRTWNYKPPGAKDIPVDFRISFLHDASNPNGTLRSKTTGEPALCMATAVPLAIRHALDSARSDAGNSDVWYEMGYPITAERILLTSLTNKQNMIL